MNGFEVNRQWYWECMNCGSNGYEDSYKDVLERMHLHRDSNPDCDETKKPKAE